MLHYAGQDFSSLRARRLKSRRSGSRPRSLFPPHRLRDEDSGGLFAPCPCPASEAIQQLRSSHANRKHAQTYYLAQQAAAALAGRPTLLPHAPAVMSRLRAGAWPWAQELGHLRPSTTWCARPPGNLLHRNPCSSASPASLGLVISSRRGTACCCWKACSPGAHARRTNHSPRWPRRCGAMAQPAPASLWLRGAQAQLVASVRPSPSSVIPTISPVGDSSPPPAGGATAANLRRQRAGPPPPCTRGSNRLIAPANLSLLQGLLLRRPGTALSLSSQATGQWRQPLCASCLFGPSGQESPTASQSSSTRSGSGQGVLPNCRGPELAARGDAD